MACEANTDWNAPTRRGSTGAAAFHTLPYARLHRPDSRPAVLGVALLEGWISSEAPCSQTCCNAHAAGGCNSGSVTPSTTASVRSPEIKPLDSFPPQKAGLVCEASTAMCASSTTSTSSCGGRSSAPNRPKKQNGQNRHSRLPEKTKPPRACVAMCAACLAGPVRSRVPHRTGR